MSRNNSSTLPRVPSSSSLSLVEDRRTRQAWIQQQLEDRRRRRDKELGEQQTELQQHHERLWSPFVREVARTHELNIAWKQDKGFFTWDRVLAFEELEALRVTGFALGTIPSQLAETFRSLTTLSLIACELESLPDSIGDLSSLTELDLTKNRLVHLPESLASLTTLQHLNLSSNLLETLPVNFGDLTGLSKLWVENNRLTVLPDSIARSKACTANFTNNRLVRLPDAIGDMVNLAHLSVNMNQLTELPDAIAKLTKLQTLHASRNKLSSLPRNIGNLVALRELRLDWNQITELPFSFRLLHSLETLCMERNPLKLPPSEYIAKGVRSTMAYMERSLEEFIRKARRQAVEKLQDILRFAMKFVDECHAKTMRGAALEPQEKLDLEILDSLFEPRVERVIKQTEKLPFFGVVWEQFFDEILPLLERRSGNTFQLLTFCTREEIEDALQHYDDFFGPASMTDRAVSFRRCACIDELEFRTTGLRKRKVCIPGQVPFKCERSAMLVRMIMMTTEEAKDQLASTYLSRKIARLVVKTKRKCVEYINSEQGVAYFEKLARELAKAHCLRRKRVRKLGVRHAKEKRGFEKQMHKLHAKREALERVRDARRKTLMEKLEAVRKERTSMGDSSKKLQRLEGKIAELEKELAKEPIESKKLLQVDLAMEALVNAEAKAVEKYEKQKATEMNDGEPLSAEEDNGEEEEDEEEGSGDDGEDTDTDDDGEENSDGEEEESEKEEKSKSPGGEPQTDDADGVSRSFFTIDMPDLHVQDYRRVTCHRIESSLGEDRVVNEEELLELYQQQLRDAYVAEKCALVEKKATYEFLQMRAVLKRWMGHGTRSVFEAWREVVKANRANAELVQQKKKRKQHIEAQNKLLAEELARVEARKWVHRVDMYTDVVYYEHSETGETSWTPPMYWEEEQQRLSQTRSNGIDRAVVPLLKLPPV